jgi:hypothetical protein
MTPIWAKSVGTAGIILATVGSGLLFFFGTPTVPNSVEVRFVGTATPEGAKRDRLVKKLQWAGLALAISGAGLQLAAVWMA